MVKRALTRLLVAMIAPLASLSAAAAGDPTERGAQRTGTAGERRPGVVAERAEERNRMVERQIAARHIRDEAVLRAMRTVPRHEFVPRALAGSAYDDSPLPIGQGQTISQPYIVALMTEAIRPGPQDRVLELGTGSGYQAAVLATIVDSVFTIEYHADLARQAEATLRRLGYDNVLVRSGDGWHGWPERAPFAAAILTFATPRIPPDVAAQLVVGGRLCLPLGEANGVQELMLYTKREDGTLQGHSLGAVRFVPVLGEGSGEE
jgi:protein-L-isoaspartate(D-aspartate) O-methyltransferase